MAGAPELCSCEKNAADLFTVRKEELCGVVDGVVYLGSASQKEVKTQSSQIALSLGEAAALPNHNFSAFSDDSYSFKIRSRNFHLKIDMHTVVLGFPPNPISLPFF